MIGNMNEENKDGNTAQDQLDMEQAASLMRAGQVQEGITILEGLLTLASPTVAEAEIRSKLGVAYAMSGRFEDAVEMLALAIKANPNFVQAYHNLCLTYTQAGALDKAIECANLGLEKNPNAIELCMVLSNAYRLSGNADKAIELMAKAVSLKPDNAMIVNHYGSMLFESGHKQQAHDCFAKAIELMPGLVSAHRMLSLVHKYQENDPYFEKLLTLADRDDLSLNQEAFIHFALGRAYEDIEDYEASFEHYKTGNAKKRQSYEYSIDQDRMFVNQVKATFPDESAWKDNAVTDVDANVTPIFIVGMPRSGTSLVEQILASHSKVHGAGELRDLDVIQFQTFELSHAEYKKNWKQLGDDDYKKMAKLYLEKLSHIAGDESFVTDKMPLNFMHLGAIAQLFPKAKIIHCKRDPRAICFSVYKTLFGTHMPFSNNQKELAAFYALYEELMAHWDRVMPGRIYHLQYEELISNPEENVAKLLDYCGIKWQDECMNFHKTKRPVVTASALQVRKPIYKSAVKYWKNFEPYMSKAIIDLKNHEKYSRKSD